MLVNHTAAKEQSSSEKLYVLDIERVQFVNNSRAKSAFVANQQALFQVPVSVLCGSVGVANFFKHLVANVLVR